MLPFPIELVAGRPIYEQIVQAVKRAVAASEFSNGDRFPSVRTISHELKVNPNTVQKAVAELIAQGLLEARVGQGCYVTAKSVSSAKEQRQAVSPIICRLVIEAAHQGLNEEGLQELIHAEWREMKLKGSKR